ncbi:hypothetical protein SBA3_2070022 [Candidatus Sulfopaludibacter sp. SbA3]|nr:hypothetical protein SBA3_2070022 [Candidatus Sulfopaludibacter sp. SbA3]
MLSSSLKDESMEAENIIRCPRCGGRDIRHSYSHSLLDFFMTLLRRVPHRCRGCSRRFYRAAAEAHDGPLGKSRIGTLQASSTGGSHNTVTVGS